MINIFPTTKAIGSYLGIPTNIMAERSMREWMVARKSSVLNSFRYIGLNIVNSAGTLYLQTGKAIINGYLVQNDADIIQQMPGGTVIHYLQLMKTNQECTDCQWQYSSSISGLSDIVVLAKTNGTSVEMAYANPGINYIGWVGNGAATREIFLGWEPAWGYVTYFSNNDANAHFGFSQDRLGYRIGFYGSNDVIGVVPSSNENFCFRPSDLGFMVNYSGSGFSLNENNVTFSAIVWAKTG